MIYFKDESLLTFEVHSHELFIYIRKELCNPYTITKKASQSKRPGCWLRYIIALEDVSFPGKFLKIWCFSQDGCNEVSCISIFFGSLEIPEFLMELFQAKVGSFLISFLLLNLTDWVSSLMSGTVRQATKSSPTVFTTVWSLSLMTLQMKHKFFILGESFSTFRTLKYLLPYMNSFMATPMRILPKVFPTLRTGIRFLSCMDSLMLIEVCFMIESFPTVATVIRFLTSVCPLVGNEVRTFLKLFPTHGTCIQPFCFLILSKCSNIDVHILWEIL